MKSGATTPERATLLEILNTTEGLGEEEAARLLAYVDRREIPALDRERLAEIVASALWRRRYPRAEHGIGPRGGDFCSRLSFWRDADAVVDALLEAAG